MNKQQEVYDTLVGLSNLNYNLSKDRNMKPLHRELIAKCETFEAAAQCVHDKFRNEIIPHDTLRFNSIREHHLQEENTDEPKLERE